jgi:hypothetical protein
LACRQEREGDGLHFPDSPNLDKISNRSRDGSAALNEGNFKYDEGQLRWGNVPVDLVLSALLCERFEPSQIEKP